jgi:hypothetical protein
MKMFANCIRNYMYLDCSSGPSPVCYFTANFMFSTAHAHNVPMYIGLMLQLLELLCTVSKHIHTAIQSRFS